MVCRILLFIYHVLHTLYHRPYTIYYVLLSIYTIYYMFVWSWPLKKRFEGLALNSKPHTPPRPERQRPSYFDARLTYSEGASTHYLRTLGMALGTRVRK